MSIYLNFGNGADGDVTISSNFNAQTGISISGRSYADAVAYTVTSVGSTSIQTSSTPNGIGIEDEVLLITLQGSPGNYDNVGNYETFRVQNVNSSTITFTSSKTKLYGQNGGDIIGSHKIIIQRIPNYNNLTINNGVTYTTSAWNGSALGVIFFRVKNTLTNNGIINTTGLGFRGGLYGTYNGGTYGFHGESINNNYNPARQPTVNWDVTRNLGGGGGSTLTDINEFSGSGGGYGTAGSDGDAHTSGASQGGDIYGVNTLAKLFLGSGGGSGSTYTGLGGDGGRGGGIIVVMASTFRNYGSILNLGNSGSPRTSGNSTAGGAGAGGSIMIQVGTLFSNSSATTGLGGINYRDNPGAPLVPRSGGAGRTAIYYKLLGDAIVNVDPAPYTSNDVIAPYKISGTLTDAADIYLFKEESGAYQEKITVSGLNYEIRTTDDSYYMLVAKPHDISKAGAVYTRVTPIVT
jgi:hypothetical protein